MTRYFPETPGGSVLAHLGASTEEQAWKSLLKETGHMYEEVEALKKRGYKVVAYCPPKRGKR